MTYRMLRQAILGFVPLNLQDFVLKIIAEVFTKSAAVVPISGLFALWSSGKGMQSLIAGLNVIYAVYVSVCARNHHKPSSSGYG